MIFITLGSQKFQFNRLLKAVDELVAAGQITEEVFAQTGYSDYTPKHYQYEPFLDRDQFAAVIEKADVVITHGGTGAIIGAVKKGKKVIAVPRRAKYGEHVDDHQLQLVEQFKDLNLICTCDDCNKLGEMLKNIRTLKFSSYRSNTQTMIDDLEETLKRMEGKEDQNKLKKYIEYAFTRLSQVLQGKIFYYKGIKLNYLSKRVVDSSNLVVVFSACTRKGIKARYNYVRTLSKMRCNQLFILDDFAQDKRGAYYLGRNLGNEIEVACEQLITSICKKDNIEKVFLCGSSKGGWAALNIMCDMPGSTAIIGAPQYLLASYLMSPALKECCNYVMPDITEENIEYLNHYLKSKLIRAAADKHTVYLHYSDCEHTYKEHISYLLEDLKSNHYEVYSECLHYNNHWNVSKYFPMYLTKTLEKCGIPNDGEK